MEEVKQTFNKLDERNKDIINLVARAMKLAEEHTEKGKDKDVNPCDN